MLDAWPIYFRKVIYENKARGFTRITYCGTFNLTTPVALLLKSVASSVGQIIPEKEAELTSIIKNGIGIRIDAEVQDFYIAANVKEKHVILALAALERIWAHTYFYLAVLEQLENHGHGVTVDLTAIPEIQPARKLATWALTCEKNITQTPWPEALPRPDKDDGSDKRIGSTNDYFYHALCFVVLHEVGHIMLQHLPDEFQDKATSYKCEFEADKWAMDFMLKDWEENGVGEKKFIGRCTGIALGLAMLAGVEFYHYAAKDDHPTIAERLQKLFEKYVPESRGPRAGTREFPIYIATAIIHGHFLNAGVPFEFLKSFEDFTSYLVDAHRAMVKLRN